MYCSKCGNSIAPSSRFCSACGTQTASYAYQAPPPSGSGNPMVRPLTNRMIGGVCAAFALHFGWDLTVTRIVTTILIVCTGVGALAYILAWVVIPEEAYPIPSTRT